MGIMGPTCARPLARLVSDRPVVLTKVAITFLLCMGAITLMKVNLYFPKGTNISLLYECETYFDISNEKWD